MFICHYISFFVKCLSRSFALFLFGCWIFRILYIFCMQVNGSNFNVGVFFLILVFFYSHLPSLTSIINHWRMIFISSYYNCYYCCSSRFSSLILSYFIPVDTSIYIMHSANNHWTSYVRANILWICQLTQVLLQVWYLISYIYVILELLANFRQV